MFCIRKNLLTILILLLLFFIGFYFVNNGGKITLFSKAAVRKIQTASPTATPTPSINNQYIINQLIKNNYTDTITEFENTSVNGHKLIQDDVQRLFLSAWVMKSLYDTSLQSLSISNLSTSSLPSFIVGNSFYLNPSWTNMFEGLPVRPHYYLPPSGSNPGFFAKIYPQTIGSGSLLSISAGAAEYNLKAIQAGQAITELAPFLPNYAGIFPYASQANSSVFITSQVGTIPMNELYTHGVPEADMNFLMTRYYNDVALKFSRNGLLQYDYDVWGNVAVSDPELIKWINSGYADKSAYESFLSNIRTNSPSIKFFVFDFEYPMVISSHYFKTTTDTGGTTLVQFIRDFDPKIEAEMWLSSGIKTTLLIPQSQIISQGGTITPELTTSIRTLVQNALENVNITPGSSFPVSVVSNGKTINLEFIKPRGLFTRSVSAASTYPPTFNLITLGQKFLNVFLPILNKFLLTVLIIDLDRTAKYEPIVYFTMTNNLFDLSTKIPCVTTNPNSLICPSGSLLASQITTQLKFNMFDLSKKIIDKKLNTAYIIANFGEEGAWNGQFRRMTQRMFPTNEIVNSENSGDIKYFIQRSAINLLDSFGVNQNISHDSVKVVKPYFEPIFYQLARQSLAPISIFLTGSNILQDLQDKKLIFNGFITATEIAPTASTNNKTIHNFKLYSYGGQVYHELLTTSFEVGSNNKKTKILSSHIETNDSATFKFKMGRDSFATFSCNLPNDAITVSNTSKNGDIYLNCVYLQ